MHPLKARRLKPSDYQKLLRGLVCSLLFWAGAAIQPASARMLSAADRAALDRLVQTEMDQQKLTGLALGVVQNGDIAYLQGYGWADLKNRRAVNLRSRFRWASVSKPVTALLSLQLAEQGRLNLDTPIHHWLPGYQNAMGWPVNQRQLLSHQAGVGHYPEISDWASRLQTYRQSIKAASATDDYRDLSQDMPAVVQAIISGQPLLFRPGTGYHYTSLGYLLAGATVAAAGQAPYLQQFQQRIAAPLGLTSMQPDTGNPGLNERVAGYYLDEQGQVQTQTQRNISWKLAGGGFSSNVYDMTRLMQAMLRHELIQPRTSEHMWTPQTLSTGKGTHYGLGVSVWQGRQPNGLPLRRIGHMGAQAAVRSDLQFWPEQNFGLVLLSNSEWADLAPLRNKIYVLLNA
ncbi:MAG: beta-lactamase family protein [Candidatus Sericytochromatia bacterium]|nr:beta-lactamase family protein [Candidatus Sericytochromatia bacterium]